METEIKSLFLLCVVSEYNILKVAYWGKNAEKLVAPFDQDAVFLLTYQKTAFTVTPVSHCQQAFPGTSHVACVHAQSCPILCDSMDCSPPGSSVHGILKARVLEQVAIMLLLLLLLSSFSRVWLLATPWTAANQDPPSMGFSRQEYWSVVPLPWKHKLILAQF